MGHPVPSVVAQRKLVDRLLEIPGVHDAAYLVRDEQVFVFSALVRAIQEAAPYQPEALSRYRLGKLVDEGMPQAWMAAETAVRRFGVHPRYCEAVQLHLASGARKFGVRHDAFNALYPRVFDTLDACQVALANLLQGGTISGGIPLSGDLVQVISGERREEVEGMWVGVDGELGTNSESRRFVYGGQSFVALRELALEEGGAPCSASDLFPDLAVPVAELLLPELEGYRGELSNLSVEAFAAFAAQARDWGVSRWVLSNGLVAADKVCVATAIEAVIVNLIGQGLFSESSAKLPSPVNSELSTLYPELARVPEASLSMWWASYQLASLGFVSTMGPYRNDLFPLYVVGGCLGFDAEQMDVCVEAGSVAVARCWQGDVHQAIDLAKAWGLRAQRFHEVFTHLKSMTAALEELAYRPMYVGCSMLWSGFEELQSQIPEIPKA